MREIIVSRCVYVCVCGQQVNFHSSNRDRENQHIVHIVERVQVYIVNDIYRKQKFVYFFSCREILWNFYFCLLYKNLNKSGETRHYQSSSFWKNSKIKPFEKHFFFFNFEDCVCGEQKPYDQSWSVHIYAIVLKLIEILSKIKNVNWVQVAVIKQQQIQSTVAAAYCGNV